MNKGNPEYIFLSVGTLVNIIVTEFQTHGWLTSFSYCLYLHHCAQINTSAGKDVNFTNGVSKSPQIRKTYCGSREERQKRSTG